MQIYCELFGADRLGCIPKFVPDLAMLIHKMDCDTYVHSVGWGIYVFVAAETRFSAN